MEGRAASNRQEDTSLGEACAREGTIPWLIVIWLGSNDVYPRSAPSRDLTAETLATIGDKLGRAARRAMDGVTLLGPLPRPSHDGDAIWEETAAFRLDSALRSLVRERLGATGAFVQCGRIVCRRVYEGGRTRVHRVDT